MTRIYRIIKNSPLCHSIPERCFTFRNHKLPICSRCIGILIGGIFFILISFLFDVVSINYLTFTILFIFPCILDSLTQELGFRISNNNLRFITGFLFGMGIVFFIQGVF